MCPLEILKSKEYFATLPDRAEGSHPVSLAEIHLINSLIGNDLDNVSLYNSLSGILQKISAVMDFEKAAIFVVEDPDTRKMACRASCAMSLRQVRAAEQEINRMASGALLRQQTPILLGGAEAEGLAVTAGLVLIAPIRSNGEFRGVLQLVCPSCRMYGQKEVHLMSLVSNQLALLLENQSLRQLRGTRPDRYESLLEKARIPVFSISDQGHFIRANRALLDLLGYSDEAELRYVNFFHQILHPKSAGARLMRIFLGSEFINDFETRLKRKDGSILSALVSSMAVHDASGKITGHEGILTDLSAKKAAAEQLDGNRKMASLGQLASGLAHDFNNLIAGITGCASMMLSDADPKTPLFEDVQTILSAARKAGDLSSRLLACGRKEKPPDGPLSVNALVSEALSLLSGTLDRNIAIRRTLYPRLSPVDGNAALLQQAVMNLCLNARDAMPEGGVLTVETENAILDPENANGRFRVEAGSYALIRIRDTGCGMDDATLQKIFEPFFTTKEGGRGNGLGLAVVREIIGKHRGGIAVTSGPGRGATFEIALPARDAEIAENGEPDELPRGTETLLFVDDEEVVRRVGQRMLERFGYRVLIAGNCADALRTLRERNGGVDLLILDKTMPRMDGAETLRKIRRVQPGIRALLTSGYLYGDQEEELKRQGFCGFIPKPFLAGQMLKKIRQSLDEPRPSLP
jgi:PAS domain S-box-containing protein